MLNNGIGGSEWTVQAEIMNKLAKRVKKMYLLTAPCKITEFKDVNGAFQPASLNSVFSSSTFVEVAKHAEGTRGAILVSKYKKIIAQMVCFL